jgi:hypothetical protein
MKRLLGPLQVAVLLIKLMVVFNGDKLSLQPLYRLRIWAGIFIFKSVTLSYPPITLEGRWHWLQLAGKIGFWAEVQRNSFWKGTISSQPFPPHRFRRRRWLGIFR